MSSPTTESQLQQQQRFKAVFLDLDGTLLRSNHKLSDATVDYLRELDAKGFFVAIATGRDITTVYEHIIRLDFPHPLPVICSNGARGLICTVHKGSSSSSSSSNDGDDDPHVTFEAIFETPVSEDVTKQAIQLSQKLGYCCQYYVSQKIFADPTQDYHFELTGKYMELTGSKTIYVKDDFQDALEIGLPSKMLILCKHADQQKMMESFKQAFDTSNGFQGECPTIILGSMGWFLEILQSGICKGNGLKLMCEHFGRFTLSECIAFGDGDNDLEFIQMAGKGIVMKNGRDVVKAVGDQVIQYTNDDDGVIKTLQQMEASGLLHY